MESDTPDVVASSTYAPFFDKSEVFPVMAVDEAWLQAIQAAQANWTERSPASGHGRPTPRVVTARSVDADDCQGGLAACGSVPSPGL